MPCQARHPPQLVPLHMHPHPSPPLHPAHLDTSYTHYLNQFRHQPDSAMKALLTSTWHVLEQPPPPSLREILGAYNSKGDGDRDMLLAMLNAKTAEDQRLASVASLHRTMLETYNAQVPQISPSLHLAHPCQHQQHFPSPPDTSYHQSPPLYPHMHSNEHPQEIASPRSRHRKHASMSPSTSAGVSYSRDRERDRESAVLSQSRKRRRVSPPPSREPRVRMDPSSSRDLPPSPYSSSSIHSNVSSPRSRESMAIGSLLSSSHDGEKEVESTKRRTSSERSTTSSSPVAQRETFKSSGARRS